MRRNVIEAELGGGSLLQISARTLTQMMSYIIKTKEGGLIVIDGGNKCSEDAENLYNEIKSAGGRVDFWFFTHAHSDHTGALAYLFDSMENFDIEIGEVCFNFPDLEWLSTKGDIEHAVTLSLLSGIERNKIKTRKIYAGDIIECGSVAVEVLHHPENYKEYKNVNSTSVILKVHFPKKSVLFLADFDAAGEAEFLKLRNKESLRCDIVQMAHHGQGGVSRSFYELIMPKVCLYTAPIWLWENNKYRCLNEETRGKGPFTIFETRRWMQELGAQVSCVDGFGDYFIE